jgi:hypothetical protein
MDSSKANDLRNNLYANPTIEEIVAQQGTVPVKRPAHADRRLLAGRRAAGGLPGRALCVAGTQ